MPGCGFMGGHSKDRVYSNYAWQTEISSLQQKSHLPYIFIKMLLLSFPNKIPHCICGNHSLLNEEIVYAANCIRAEITMKAAGNSK